MHNINLACSQPEHLGRHRSREGIEEENDEDHQKKHDDPDYEVPERDDGRGMIPIMKCLIGGLNIRNSKIFLSFLSIGIDVNS